ncbi:MAG: YicC/YloC family endoribonuclease [Imperialibacter sp.]|uniref:YicC/YloC family endoribonuclease n=1 Tax=Imperialibacter sp. TaxID=2038411 RepID=UPI0032EEE255
MIKSMTGYGSASFENSECKLSIEVKTLNSKFLDLSLKLPKTIQEYEMEVKTLISEILIRGKVNINFDYEENKKEEVRYSVNSVFFEQYYQQLKSISTGLAVSDESLFRQTMQMPEVLQQREDTEDARISLEEVLQTMRKALEACDKFRDKEGEVLYGNFVSYIGVIRHNLGEVAKRDPERIKGIKERIEKNLTDVVGKEKVDQNRFEQELIYYIEKLDIAEEKVRLESHLNFFIEALGSPESNGKKLAFISQEIGREINTIGSKANDAIVQRLVIEMKEELEKIKEQLLNIL